MAGAGSYIFPSGGSKAEPLVLLLGISLLANEAECPFQVFIGHLHEHMNSSCIKYLLKSLLVLLSLRHTVVRFFASSVGKPLVRDLFCRVASPVPAQSMACLFIKNAFRGLGMWFSW